MKNSFLAWQKVQHCSASQVSIKLVYRDLFYSMIDRNAIKITINKVIKKFLEDALYRRRMIIVLVLVFLRKTLNWSLNTFESEPLGVSYWNAIKITIKKVIKKCLEDVLYRMPMILGLVLVLLRKALNWSLHTFHWVKPLS